MYSRHHQDTYSTPEGTINIYTKYRNHLLTEQKNLEGEELNVKNLLLYERWKVQELNKSKKLQNRFSELQVQNQNLQIKYNELLKEKNDEEMKLNSERFKNFETYMVANDYTAQIRNLKEESTIIRNFNENFKKQIENYKIEIRKLQDPHKELTLDELKIFLTDVRHQNKRLEAENEVLEKRNIWFQNQINNLLKEVDQCKKKIGEINEHRSRTYGFHQSRPEKEDRSKYEQAERMKREREAESEQKREKIAKERAAEWRKNNGTEKGNEETEDSPLVIQRALDHLNIRQGEQGNSYKILGLGQKAIRQDIIKAYHRLAREFHPDKNDNDVSKMLAFKWVVNAYQGLSANFPVTSLYNISLDSLFDPHLVFAEFNSAKFQKSRDMYQYCV
jgi:curved DNA-binding protein CbpA